MVIIQLIYMICLNTDEKWHMINTINILMNLDYSLSYKQLKFYIRIY